MLSHLWEIVYDETVAQFLGHMSIDCSQRYVDVDDFILHAMFSNIV